MINNILVKMINNILEELFIISENIKNINIIKIAKNNVHILTFYVNKLNINYDNIYKLKNHIYENSKDLFFNFFQNINFNQCKPNSFIFYPIYGSIIGTFTFPTFIILFLTLIGFTIDGIRLGSYAALWMSNYKGYVPKGSIFSLTQSIGMLGIRAGINKKSMIIGSIVGCYIGYKFNNYI